MNQIPTTTFWRINPPHLRIIEEMDSNDPNGFSLKYQLSQIFINESEEHLREIGQGAIADEIFLLERIRQEHYSERPSRLSAIFCFDNVSEAEKFSKSGWTEKDGITVEYNITKLYTPIFIGDMSLTNIIGNLRKLWSEYKYKTAVPFIKPTLQESLEAIAHLYWQGKTAEQVGLGSGNSIREVLINGAIKKRV